MAAPHGRSRITVSRNFRLTTGRAMSVTTAKECGLYLAAQIENRTRSGRDDLGKSFIEYSDDYAKRVKHRKRPVDLVHTGKMLGDLGVVVATNTRIGIGFTSAEAEQRAEYHDGLAGHDGKRGSNPLRRFMGVQPSWITEVVRRIRTALPFR
jgi:hypothetical protein